MPARSLFQRSRQHGPGATVPLSDRIINASRSLVAPALDSERPAWERFSPLLLLAILSTLPFVAVASGSGALFNSWLAAAYALAAYLWVERAVARADRSHYWRGYVVTVAVLIIVSLQIPEPARGVLAVLIGLSAVAASAAGIRLHTPPQSLPWYMLVAALALLEAGHLVSVIWSVRDKPIPLFTSLISLVGLALLPVALWSLIYRRTRGSSRTILIDTAVVSAGLAMLAWVYLIAPQVTDPAPAMGQRIAILGWPIVGLAASAVAVRFLLTRWPVENSARQLTGAALVLTLASIVATSWVTEQRVTAGEHPGMNVLWLLGLAGFGAAALHPSMVRLATPIHELPSALNWQRMLLLTVVLLLGPVALLSQHARGDKPTIEVLTLGAVLLGLLFATRMATALRTLALRGAAERHLRLAAADLVVTTGHDAIIQIALDTSDVIGGRRVATSLYLHDGAPGEFIYHTGDGNGPRRIIRERDLPRSTNRVLATGRSAWLDPDEVAAVRGPLGLDELATVVSIAPIGANPGIRGLLISSGNELTAEVARGMETLAALLGLALDRQRLADALGYAPGRNIVRARSDTGEAFTFVEVATEEPVNVEAVEQSSIAGAVRAAIEDDLLITCFQPRFDLTTGRIAGVEMTPAWESPLVGTIPGPALAAIAVEHGLCRELRFALLIRACRQAVDWQTRHPQRSLDVTLPLSQSEIDAPGLDEDVHSALTETNCAASLLVLQVPAAMLIEATSSALAALADLAAIGVQLSVSDAGTSWSELDRLQTLPVSMFEVESSLIHLLDSNERAAAIVTHLITRAHHQGARILAQGVDCRDHWILLRKLGCDLGQGGLFSPRIDSAGIDGLLNRARQRAKE